MQHAPKLPALSLRAGPDVVPITRELLRWFAARARDLPWRHTTDPYATWISEIMLQQTQVRTVIPYWQRWMQQLPDASALARASIPEVLKLWEGLGYYTRARNLHRAAQIIVEQHGGILPQTLEGLLALPGIGRYTAGAICSIAYNQPTPVLDGNVIRVLTRLWAIRKDPQNPRVKERLWGIATELVQQALCTPRIPAPASERAWVYGAGPCSQLNQALMELGAVICTPREPACSTCPLRKLCVARARDLTTVLPVTGTTIIYTARRFLAFVVQDHSRFLVRQRPRAGLNAELWEFPSVEVTPTFTHTTNSAVSHCPGAPPNVGALCTIKHCQTRYRITLQVFQAVVCRRKIPTRADERWLTLKQLDALPFSSAHRRILDRLRTIPVH